MQPSPDWARLSDGQLDGRTDGRTRAYALFDLVEDERESQSRARTNSAELSSPHISPRTGAQFFVWTKNY